MFSRSQWLPCAADRQKHVYAGQSRDKVSMTVAKLTRTTAPSPPPTAVVVVVVVVVVVADADAEAVLVVLLVVFVGTCHYRMWQ